MGLVSLAKESETIVVAAFTAIVPKESKTIVVQAFFRVWRVFLSFFIIPSKVSG